MPAPVKTVPYCPGTSCLLFLSMLRLRPSRRISRGMNRPGCKFLVGPGFDHLTLAHDILLSESIICDILCEMIITVRSFLYRVQAQFYLFGRDCVEACGGSSRKMIVRVLQETCALWLSSAAGRPRGMWRVSGNLRALRFHLLVYVSLMAASTTCSKVALGLP